MPRSANVCPRNRVRYSEWPDHESSSLIRTGSTLGAGQEHLKTMNETHMKRAVALSKSGMELGHGGPFGAVIVRDGSEERGHAVAGRR